MFLLNSCLGHFTATRLLWHPFSRSYGVNLPSSLTTILPMVLGFSPHLPVSVCGTGTMSLPRGFSWQREIRYSKPVGFSPSHLEINKQRDLPPCSLSVLGRTIQSYAHLILLRHPFGQTLRSGIGISTDCPSPTPLGLGLGPD